AEERLAALETRTMDTIQRCNVAYRRVDLYATLGSGEMGVPVALECLRHVGINWSVHPTDAEACAEYARFWSQLGSRAFEELLDLPPMQDPEVRATLDVLASLILPTLYTDKNLYALTVCRATNLSLEHGNSDSAPVNYSAI